MQRRPTTGLERGALKWAEGCWKRFCRLHAPAEDHNPMRRRPKPAFSDRRTLKFGGIGSAMAGASNQAHSDDLVKTATLQKPGVHNTGAAASTLACSSLPYQECNDDGLSGGVTLPGWQARNRRRTSGNKCQDCGSGWTVRRANANAHC
eukprot:365417-Chlamydomonas_euryale.AAC.16